jgi:hypothetical protein
MWQMVAPPPPFFLELLKVLRLGGSKEACEDALLFKRINI